MDNSSQSTTPKQQIVETIKSATNVLVTVSRDPSVDQLSACIGLTLMLNKLGKHGTAVFSGSVPATLEFLQPEKTIETNTDSLRDFIISLDRNKADKLRYKVEDDVVKIFITPYRTTLTGDDLQFSQGDFNVDVVVALGVDKREHLDEAIIAHGRILHDAKVIGISAGEIPTDIGSVNWHESAASSLSEMLVSISESFQSGILDAQMSTAFLTGIVAETDRFKNQKTTPKVMTMSAQLMASGANQQLIATQLALPPKELEPQPEPQPEPQSEPDTTPESEHVPIAEQETVKAPEPPAVSEEPEPIAEPEPELPAPVEEPGTLNVQDGEPDEEGQSVPLHEETPVVETTSEPQPEPEKGEIHIDEHGMLTDEEEHKTRQKVIQPLTMKPEEPKTDLSTYIFEEPQHNGTFTANTQPESTEAIIDPLSANVTSPGAPEPSMLDHESTPPAQEQVPEPENVAPDVNDVVSVPEPLVSNDTPSMSEGVPEPAQEATPELPPAPSLDELKMDEDAARQAVLQAVAATDPAVPSHNPIEALNAQPMPLDQPLIDPATGQAAPPAVPPPMVTPPDLPLPGADQPPKAA